MEQGRALSLFDQMELQGVDLLAGVPEHEASRLRREQAKVREEIAGLESQLAKEEPSSTKREIDLGWRGLAWPGSTIPWTH